MNRSSLSLCIRGAEPAALGLQHSAWSTPERIRNLWPRTRFWTSPLSTHRTALAVTARKDAEERRLRWPIPFISPSSMKRTMRKVIANGVRGTSMPAFAQSCRGNADRTSRST